MYLFLSFTFPSFFLSCLRTQKIRKRKVGYFRQDRPGNKCFETHLCFLQSHRSYTVNHPAESSEQPLPLASNPVAGTGWRWIPGARQRFRLINTRSSGTRALTLGRKQGRQKRPLTENRQTRAPRHLFFMALVTTETHTWWNDAYLYVRTDLRMSAKYLYYKSEEF